MILGRLLSGLAVLAALFSIACGLIVADGLRDRPGRADVGVVLGSHVWRDGTPTAGLAARLDRGLAAWQAGLVPRLIVSGGFDRSGRNETPGMRRYLLERGVPDSCIVVDPRGQNTWLTARNTRAWMDARGLRRVLVVSDYYHLPRCRLAFARHGLPAVFALHAHHVGLRDLLATAREVPALIKYAVRWDF